MTRFSEGFERRCPVAAIDLLPGSQPGAKGEFALVIIDCDKKVVLNKRVNVKKLIRFLWEFRPKILAVDNIAELGKNRKEIIKILNMMPPETDVVQVTRVCGEFVDLKKLAKNMGIKVPSGKLEPEDTAYLLALLASEGIGTKIKVFEEKTKIIVTKGRTPRAGGSSMNRFLRATKNAVIETVNEIKEKLDKEGLDYDLVMKNNDGSIVSASFTVYAPRKKLEGLVKPINTSAVRVKIRPVVTRKFLFDEDERGSKALIVGLDPGIQTGIAILDINGNVLYLDSFQNVDRGDIVALISKFGKPIIIATDTSPPNHASKKLAAMLQADLYYPNSSLSVKEKEKIAMEYAKKGIEVKDSHQRDALAAAHKAFLSIKDKLDKVDAYLDKLGLDIDRELIKIEVLKGKSIAELVEREIGKLLAEEEMIEEVDSKHTKDREAQSQKESVKNDLRLAFLEAENVQLKMRIKELEDEIERLNLQLNIIRKEVSNEVERRTEAIKHTLKLVSKKLKEKEKEVESLKDALKRAGEDIASVDRREKFVALHIDKVVFTSELPLEDVKALRVPAIYINNLDDLNDEFAELLKEHRIMLFVNKMKRGAEETLLKHGVAAVKADANVYDKYAVLSINYIEKWKLESKKVREKKSLSLAELERMLLEYRAERWGRGEPKV